MEAKKLVSYVASIWSILVVAAFVVDPDSQEWVYTAMFYLFIFLTVLAASIAIAMPRSRQGDLIDPGDE